MKDVINSKNAFTKRLGPAAMALLVSVMGHAESLTATWDSPPTTLADRELAEAQAVNYTVRIQWKDANGMTNRIQIMTAEGEFKTDTIKLDQSKNNDTLPPSLATLSGRLNVLSPEKGRLSLNFDWKTPIVVNTGAANGTNAPSRSYQYISTGLNSTFIVTFGKPLAAQADESTEVTILVKRAEDQ